MDFVILEKIFIHLTEKGGLHCQKITNVCLLFSTIFSPFFNILFSRITSFSVANNHFLFSMTNNEF